VRFDFGTGGGGGGGGGGGFETDDFSDFFESLFGGRRGGGRAGAGFGRATGFGGGTTRGADQEAEIEVTLEEAVRGGRRHVVLQDGREYDVQIPPGVRDGQRIRLAGEGGAGAGRGPAGDLYLRVRLRPDRRFRLQDRDVIVDLPVAPWEAALGAEVEVPTLRGRARVRVPPGSSSGRRLRLRGEGMPDPRGAAGDLYAAVRIVVPRRLTAEERELFERLRSVSRFDPRSGT
jgi:curved DNA-binding protein